MLADSKVDFLDSTVQLTVLQPLVGFEDDGGDGRGHPDSWREAGGYGVSTNAFDKACWSSPGPRGIREGGRGGFQVGSGNDLEQGVPWGPRELLGDMLVACNGVLDGFSGGSGTCLFGLSWARC